MDWHEPMHTKLWVLPAGQARQGMGQQADSLNWTSRYGSLGASSYDAAIADGLNEKGLSAHLLWLAESDYGNKANQPNLSVSMWAQYYLDNFATVSEAVEHTREHPFNVVTANIPGTNTEVTVHLALNDSTGDTAVFEFVGGKLQIHHSRDYCVMTNSPTFDKQLANIKLYDGFGGSKPLPGSTEADDRFVRTAYYLNRLQKPADERAAVAGIMSVLRNAAQPYSTPDPSRPNISPTLWRTVADHSHLLYFFEATNSPYLVWTDLHKFNLKIGEPTLMADVESNPDWYGDITSKFKPTDLFTWVLPKS